MTPDEGSNFKNTLSPAKEAAERVVDFFDRRAAQYSREYTQETPAGYALRIRRRKVLELFGQSGGDVLDVGCGPGVMTEEMLARGCTFFGIDPSPNVIAIGRERFEARRDVHFILGDAERLPFRDGRFDAVLCMGVIDSLMDGTHALREMVRVLKPQGTFIITFANLLSPYASWKAYGYYPLLGWWHRFRATLGDPTMTASRIRSCPLRRLHTRAGATALVESVGARVIDAVPYHFNVFLPPLDDLMPQTALRVTRAMEEGRLSWPGWIAAGWILKAKKS